MASNACECGEELGWVRVEEDPDGGWWQCQNRHQWRRRGGRLVPLVDPED